MEKENNFKNYITIGNVTTIVNSIIVILFGYLLGYLTSLGFNLPVDESLITSLMSSIVFGLFSYINAKYHNQIWDSEQDTVRIPVNFTDSEVKAVENFINQIKIEDKTNNDKCGDEEVFIDDLDPANEYEGENDHV